MQQKNIYKIWVVSNGSWEEIELDDLNLSTVFSVEEIYDISQRKDSITKSIVLKGTKRNNLVFGALYNIDRDTVTDAVDPKNLFYNYKPNKYVDCFVLENNIEIIRGKLLVTNVDLRKGTIYYNCSIVGKVYSFFSELNDRYLTELDSFKEYDVVFNKTNTENSWTNNLPYVLTMIDHGGRRTTSLDTDWSPNKHILRWENIRPSIKVKEYLDAIFRGFRINSGGNITQYEDNGTTLINNYRWEGSIKSENWFNRLIIPHNEPHLTRKLVGTTQNSVADSVYQITVNATGIGTNARDGKNFRTLDGGTFVQTSSSPYFAIGDKELVNPPNPKTYRGIELLSPVRAKIVVSGTANLGYDSGTMFIARLKRSETDAGVVGEFSDADFIYSKPLAAGTNDLFLEVPAQELDGMLVVGYVTKNLSSPTELTVTNMKISLVSETREGVDVQPLWGDTFNLFDMLPRDTPIKEFLKSIMLLFNLYIVADKEDDTLYRIYTYDEFYSDILKLDKSKAIDWSDKVDWENYRINTNINLPRGYTYTYKADNDAMNTLYTRNWNEVYGMRSILDSSGLIAPKRVETLFSPTILLNFWSNVTIPAIWGGQLGVGLREPIKSNLRILFFSGAINVTGEPFELLDSTNSEIAGVSFDKFPFTSMNLYSISNGVRGNLLKSLNFGIPIENWSGANGDDMSMDDIEYTLYNTHYLNQIKELTDVNLIMMEVSVYLNEADINSLDFRVPIYIQSPNGSAYFKILRVEYNDASSSSRVLLQKIVLPDTNRTSAL